MGMSFQRIGIFIIVVGLWVSGSLAWGELFFVGLAYPNQPRNFTYRFTCYDFVHGTWVLTDCRVNLRVAGPSDEISYNGGHTHDLSTRPPFGNPQGWTCTNCVDLDTTQEGIITQTEGKTIDILYPLPNVAGGIEVEGEVTFSGQAGCYGDCVIDDTMIVGLPYLQPLPIMTSPDLGFYVTFRNPDTTHTNANAFWATSDTIDLLLLVAEEYWVSTTDNFTHLGEPLSVNDMSLPLGGLFDWKVLLDPAFEWKTPHITHRQGRDVDINPLGVACQVDKDLKKAVAIVRRTHPGVRLHCEDNGNKHINFD